MALESNTGFARGNNRGIRETASELVLLLNSDTMVPDGAIDALVSSLRELPGAAVTGPRIVDANGLPELSFGRMIGPLAELRQKALVRFASHARLDAMTSETREVDWVTGACLLVRRRDAEAAGLFDERYFMYCEDVDFCAAIRANGGRVYFTPSGPHRPPSRPLLARQSRRHCRTLPPQPAGVLRETPPRLGPDSQAVPGSSRKAAGVNGR